MMKKIMIIALFGLLSNCLFQIGKIGYVSLPDKEPEKVPEQVVGRYCGVIILGMIEKLHNELKNQGEVSFKDVNLVFKQEFAQSCLEVRKKGEQK